MVSTNSIQVAVLPGDGVGREVMEPCLHCLDALVDKVGGFAFHYETIEAGANLYAETGNALPDEAVKRADAADVMLLGAMGLPHIRYPDGREIAPQVDLREIFGLYAGVRPVRTWSGGPCPLKDERAQALDFVLVRESTEGLFRARGNTKMVGDEEAHDTMVITRKGSERVFDFSYRLARRRKERRGTPGKLTCVDKANVFESFAFFRKIFDERGDHFSDVERDYCYVDAAALNILRNPWVFDVMVTENMFGDILSDECAALMGGMGMAPSADIGDDHALFQPCHGTAPDIMGTGKANPTAMLLSGAMMLDWLGDEHGSQAFSEAGQLFEDAVIKAFEGGGLVPCEVGGNAGLKEVTDRVLENIRSA